MMTRDSYIDDDGVKWEMRYDDVTTYEGDEDGKLVIVDGSPVSSRSISKFTYRREGEEEWRSLPPWATIRDEAKITLCFFDEDEETNDLTYLSVA